MWMGIRNTSNPASRFLCFALPLACAVISMLAGCAAHDRGRLSGPAPVWPPPPEKARICYVDSIGGPADYGLKPSMWRRCFNFITGSDNGVEPFVQPAGVAVDEAGNLCIADPGARAVSVFEREKRKATRWTSAGEFRFASPVAVAKLRDVVFVADSALGKVLAFNLKGKVVFSTGKEMTRPAGLAVHGNNLLVADVQQHCICVYTLRGALLRKIGKRGAGHGEFNFPTHIAVDGVGRIYVTDSMNMRVQVLSQSGEYIETIGSVGDSSGHFSRPKGVAVDRFGHVYVVDALFDNVQIFDAKGTLLLGWGSSGAGMGEFWLPTGIAAGNDDLIYVADSSNRRIQIFKYVGGE